MIPSITTILRWAANIPKVKASLVGGSPPMASEEDGAGRGNHSIRQTVSLLLFLLNVPLVSPNQTSRPLLSPNERIKWIAAT
jgi:hypothetical protein